MLTQFSITKDGDKFVSIVTPCSAFQYDESLQCAVFSFYTDKRINACIPMTEDQYVAYVFDATRVLGQRKKQLIVTDKCYTHGYYESHIEELQSESTDYTDDSICEDKLISVGAICRRKTK